MLLNVRIDKDAFKSGQGADKYAYAPNGFPGWKAVVPAFHHNPQPALRARLPASTPYRACFHLEADDS